MDSCQAVLDPGVLLFGLPLISLQQTPVFRTGFRSRAKTLEAARDVVEHLGPDDLASVVFTGDNRSPQDFTSDHASLLASINTLGMGWGGANSYVVGNPIFPCYAVKTLGRVADYLIAIPQRRKALIYVSHGVDVDFSGRGGSQVPYDLVGDTKKIFANAQQANVNVYSVDPDGESMSRTWGVKSEFLQALSENTGGFAILHGEFAQGITQIFRENSSYYLVGYESSDTKANGDFRRLGVRVDRPGVTVQTRKGYYGPRAVVPPKPGTAPPSPLDTAMAGVLPKSDLKLQLNATPFALPHGAHGNGTGVVLVLGVTQSAEETRGPRSIDVQVNAFDREGRPKGRPQTTHVVVQPNPSGTDADVTRDILSRLDLAPGRYSLRLSAHNLALGKTGSVYADVDVPDFSNDAVSLLGVMLTREGGIAPGPADALAALVPVLPTSQRAFAASDRVTAFLRVYEGGKTAADLQVRRSDDCQGRRPKCGRRYVPPDPALHADRTRADLAEAHRAKAGRPLPHTSVLTRLRTPVS